MEKSHLGTEHGRWGIPVLTREARLLLLEETVGAA
jgi:hypothetical protein